MVDENKEVQTQSAATAEAPVAESTSATPAHATEITSTLDGTHSVDPADAGPGGPADEVGDGEEKKDEVADVVADPEPDPEPPAPAAAAAVPPAADPDPAVSKDLAETHEIPTPKPEEPKPVISESPSTYDLDSIGTAQDTGTFEDGKLIQPGVNGANLGPRGEGGVPLDAIVPDKRPVATVTKNTVTDNIDSAGNDQGVHAPIGPRGVGRAPDSYRQ